MPYASEIANVILYTPLDTKAVVDNYVSSQLTYNEFINNCYVLPQFQGNVDYSVTDDYIESYDYVVKYDQIRDLHAQQRKDFGNFVKWLEAENNHKIYTISGNAGTGKTTFIHRLKYEHSDKNWVILDVAQSRDFVDWFNGIQTDINDFHTAYGKLYAAVLGQLHGMLFGCNRQSELQSAVDNLKQMLSVYSTKFRESFIRGKEYFDGLLGAVNKGSTKQNYYLISECAIFTQNYFEQIAQHHNYESKRIFRSALDVLLIACCCLSNSSKHIIVFDNLERFIAHDEIYNKDLDVIRRELASYSYNLNSKFNYFQCVFKFIMGMRTSSARMCGVKLHSADELASNLDLTDWFLIDDIIEKKIKWYHDHNIRTTAIETLTQIVCDLRTCNKHELTGLQLFINPLFNENIRLIIDFMGTIIEKSSNASNILKYKELWAENTPVSRFAARSIIRGLIYQELDQNDNLFKHLQLYTEIAQNQKDGTRTNYGLSYVRKILTILYNHSETDITLEHVIAELCSIKTRVQHYWNTILSDKCKNDIAEVLYYMNSYNRRENDWVQFIDLQIIGMTSSTSIDDIQTLRELIDNNLQSISLRIMPAGKAYLRYIVNSFEFFSFRFHRKHVSQYQPLFSVIPTQNEIAGCQSVKKLPCYIILNYVKENALKCIDNVEENGDIKLNIIDFHSQKHMQRVIQHHQGYIDKFVDYLKFKYMADYYSGGRIKKLVEECIAIRDEYNKYRIK